MKRLSLICLVAGSLFAGCKTQRIPGPMSRPEGMALPPGQGHDYVPGPQEVVVLRHGDPVSVRRPSARAGFPLTFHNKRLRVGSGGWVLAGTGGRAEVMWPGTSSAVQLFDKSAVMIGEPSRAETILTLKHCAYARIKLSAGDRLTLVGGSILEADAEFDSGPFDFKTVSRDRISITNNGRTVSMIHFLQEVLSLGPGERMDLPILPGGSGPRPPAWRAETLAVDPGFLGPAPIGHGALERIPSLGQLSLRAKESVEVEALGVSVAIDEGQVVIFTPTGSRP